MELIIKPTMRCNFKCTFCSSTEIADSNNQTLPHEQIFKFLKRFPQTNTIIVNGGDGLMIPVEYYWKLLGYFKDNNLKTTLSFTTNLWDFYKHPEKWEELFKHPQVGVGTSFQYGDKRRVTSTLIYTEDLFNKVMELFNKRIGYYPGFISVIDEDNVDSCVKTVELAKKYGVVVKLNYAYASGRQTSPFYLARMYKEYLKIYNLGLAAWEYNTNQIFIDKTRRTCPISRNCDSGIRAMNPDGSYFSCGSFADDNKYPINFESEMKSANIFTPLAAAVELHSLKDDCLTCPLFSLCNGCKKQISDLKQAKLVEQHCSMMKAQLPEILEALNGTKINQV